jgi:hypothetical protein
MSIKGIVRGEYEQRTVKHLQPHEIAVICHEDLDE